MIAIRNGLTGTVTRRDESDVELLASRSASELTLSRPNRQGV